MSSFEAARDVSFVRIQDADARARKAPVVIEEPLEIRLDDEVIAVTMRTPGHDIELAFGFLVTEDVVEDSGAIAAISHCPEDPNVIEARSPAGRPARSAVPPRRFYASSSCGICGKASIDAIHARRRSLAHDALRVRAALLQTLPDRMRSGQELFRATGSLHAAALFRPDGELICLREDVGRHNAVDKVVGWAAGRDGLPLCGHLLLVSGRVSFEIVQKAMVAGIPILAAISGPSSLAVDLAREADITLIAFLRGETMNVYSGAQRVLTG